MTASAPRAPQGIRTFVCVLLAASIATGILAVLAPHASAQTPAPYFGTNVRVSTTPAYSGADPFVAVTTSGVEYVAFSGSGGAARGTDIFFTKSTDAGRTWSVPLRVNDDAGAAAQGSPTIRIAGNNTIDIVWTDSRAGTNDIYFAWSADAGATFSANKRVNDVVGKAQFKSDMAVDSQGRVHVIWEDLRNGGAGKADIFVASSADGGQSFNASVRVNDGPAGTTAQSRPRIVAAPNETLYAAWDDARNAGSRGRDIYFSQSMDHGSTWSANVPVNDDTGMTDQMDVALAVDAAGTLYTAWADSRNVDTAPDIYATRSTDAGTTFAANVKVNDDAGSGWQDFPRIQANGGVVRVVWADGRTSGSTSIDIYSSASPDGRAWGANVKVNDDVLPLNAQTVPSVALDATGNAFVAWSDGRASGQDAYAATLDIHPPTASAGPALSVGQGASVPFSASASSDDLGIAVYAWDFGDGAQSTGIAPTHSYPNAGTYAVFLTVWDYSGNSAATSVSVTVNDTEAPVARGAGDRTADAGQSLFFDASASTDNVGVTSYHWDFGDGANSTSAAASHVYDTAGTYTATLTVRDAAGNQNAISMTVMVRAVSPGLPDLQEAVRGLQNMVNLLALIAVVLGVALLLVGFMVVRTRRDQGPPSTKTAPPSQPMD